MIWLNDWCDVIAAQAGAHGLQILTARQDDLPFAQDALAAAVPSHYASAERIARILERFGKTAAAAFIREKLPETKSIRSGDLGEILATEYIGEQTSYLVPIKRLRWKDHRNMAMRGEDVIGIYRQPGPRPLRFLKTEAKSRANLVASVIAEARAALDKDNGLPSAHALAFVSERLMETVTKTSPTPSTTRSSKAALAFKASATCCLRSPATTPPRSSDLVWKITTERYPKARSGSVWSAMPILCASSMRR